MMKTCLILLLVAATITTAMHTENHLSQSKRNETEPCSRLGRDWTPFPNATTCTTNKHCQDILTNVSVKCDKRNGVCCQKGGGGPPPPQLTSSDTPTSEPCNNDGDCSGGRKCKMARVCVKKRSCIMFVPVTQCKKNKDCREEINQRLGIKGKFKCKKAGVCCEATGCDLQPDPSGGSCVNDQECVANFGPGSVCNTSILTCFFCGAAESAPVNVCDLPPDSGSCTNQITAWFHNSTSMMCETFIYGGCGGNDNRFPTEDACEQECGATAAPPVKACDQPLETGNCNDTIVSWYWDSGMEECLSFTYTGCGGNDNRFPTEEACKAECDPPEQPTPPTI